jgi:hypothetical protein
MPERLPAFERDFQETAKGVRRTLKTLSGSDNRPAPEKYLAVMRNIRVLRESWRRHVEAELTLDPAMFSPEMIKEFEDIDRQLASILAAAWPRSPEAGLQSIRSRVTAVLARLLNQAELERAAIVSELRSRRQAAHVDSSVSELVAT